MNEKSVGKILSLFLTLMQRSLVVPKEELNGLIADVGKNLNDILYDLIPNFDALTGLFPGDFAGIVYDKIFYFRIMIDYQENIYLDIPIDERFILTPEILFTWIRDAVRYTGLEKTITDKINHLERIYWENKYKKHRRIIDGYEDAK